MKRLSEKNRRILTLFFLMGATIFAPFCYFLLVKLMGRGLPCLVLMLTGLYCPACGVTRMATALLAGDLAGAFRYHPLLMLLIPIGLCYGAYRAVIYIKCGDVPAKRWEKVFVASAVALILLFGVLRNLPMFSFLAPI